MNIKILTLNPEISGGIALFLAALLALVVNNAGGAGLYHNVLEFPLTVGFAPIALTKTLHHWINDGLMVLFFVLVGVEIQREIREGSLKEPRKALVPTLAALGGFIAPAIVYMIATQSSPELHRGWGIPTATDIAFAVALATMLKNHIPPTLRVFLLALAVVDDILAILAIAIFYTSDIIWMNLLFASMGALLLAGKNRLNIQMLWVYIVVGLAMWLFVMLSGVHATIAGVLLGLLLPLKGKRGKQAPADKVEHALKPWVMWLVLPLFAFANVGITFAGMSLSTLVAPVTLGIAGGLFLGKQLGIFGTVWASTHVFGLPHPVGASWRHIYGVACLCGIGFTMSLFVGALALPAELQPQVRLGIILGSVASTLIGAIILTQKHIFSLHSQKM